MLIHRQPPVHEGAKYPIGCVSNTRQIPQGIGILKAQLNKDVPEAIHIVAIAESDGRELDGPGARRGDSHSHVWDSVRVIQIARDAGNLA